MTRRFIWSKSISLSYNVIVSKQAFSINKIEVYEYLLLCYIIIIIIAVVVFFFFFYVNSNNIT